MIRLALAHALFALFAFGATDYALSIPQVMTSHSTGECVAVIADKGILFDNTGYSCQRLPDTYHRAWVR